MKNQQQTKKTETKLAPIAIVELENVTKNNNTGLGG